MEHRLKSTTAHSPSNSMLVPYDLRHLAVVPSEIPAGWGVEEVTRRNGSHTDRYYYEAGTGRKFRSIREVDRYLSAIKLGYPCTRSTTNKPTYNHKSDYQRMLVSSDRQRKMIVSGGKLMRVDDDIHGSDLSKGPCETPPGMAAFSLPDGWIVEEVPRRYNSWADKYYYEPETGRKFRSLVAVERHLAELEDNAPLAKALEEIKENRPLSKVFKLVNLAKKKKVTEANTQASSFIDPPMKVKWVLASPQGDIWNAYIADTLIPEAVKQQWAKRFELFMNDGNQ
ncbi:Methyl-CpG binding domain [Castilleja foliolosa]|uniref:Methyl-CpG binding domain n=1 Tax=Castilleja foliolosa TaxID=1961234 RepID=A0ABD3C7W3_9LAMI